MTYAWGTRVSAGVSEGPCTPMGIGTGIEAPSRSSAGGGDPHPPRRDKERLGDHQNLNFARFPRNHFTVFPIPSLKPTVSSNPVKP